MKARQCAARPQPVVLMTPDWRAGNPYLDLLGGAVAAQDWEVRFADLPDGDFALTQLVRRERPDVLHLHWSNDLLAPCAWARHAAVGWLRRRKLVADVRAARRAGARVVWTVHNLVAHESSHLQRELRARAVLADAVDHVIVHSEGDRTVAYRHGRDVYEAAREPKRFIGLSGDAHWLPMVEGRDYTREILEFLKTP